LFSIYQINYKFRIIAFNLIIKFEIDALLFSFYTIGPAIDSSATLNSGKNGTTGATGESSTGSGTDVSTQKGKNIKTDSI